MRAARNTESYVRADITLKLMQAHKCSLPKRAPSEMTFALAALECRTEMTKGNFKAAQCDKSAWKGLGEK